MGSGLLCLINAGISTHTQHGCSHIQSEQGDTCLLMQSIRDVLGQDLVTCDQVREC